MFHHSYLQLGRSLQHARPTDWVMQEGETRQRDEHHAYLDEIEANRLFYERNRSLFPGDSSNRSPVELYHKWIFDTGGTLVIACNPSVFVAGSIRRMARPIWYITNAGNRVIEWEGDVENIPFPVQFDPNGVTNVVGFSALRRVGFTVEYDHDEDQFVLWNPAGDRSTIFDEDSGLYTADPREWRRYKNRDYQEAEEGVDDDLEENPGLYYEHQFHNEGVHNYRTNIFL